MSRRGVIIRAILFCPEDRAILAPFSRAAFPAATTWQHSTMGELSLQEFAIPLKPEDLQTPSDNDDYRLEKDFDAELKSEKELSKIIDGALALLSPRATYFAFSYWRIRAFSSIFRCSAFFLAC